MNIGIIGYGNQSRKIINLILKHKRATRILIYYYKKKKFIKLKKSNRNKRIVFCNRLNELKNLDCVFIASPNETHVKYLKHFLKYKTYIFCEKPPCTSIKESRYLMKLDTKFKKKIYFNFNYNQSSLKTILKKLILKNQNGKPIFTSISFSHGIAFNSKKYSKWRLKQKNIFDNILGNLGIHYLELLISLFGKIKKMNFVSENHSNRKSFDTGIINLSFKKKMHAVIYLSYAASFDQSIKIHLTNSLIELRNKKLFFYFPRDSFDKSGKYCYPKIKLIKNFSKGLHIESLDSSLKFFLDKVYYRRMINQQHFNNALYLSKILIEKDNKFRFLKNEK